MLYKSTLLDFTLCLVQQRRTSWVVCCNEIYRLYSIFWAQTKHWTTCITCQMLRCKVRLWILIVLVWVFRYMSTARCSAGEDGLVWQAKCWNTGTLCHLLLVLYMTNAITDPSIKCWKLPAAQINDQQGIHRHQTPPQYHNTTSGSRLKVQPSTHCHTTQYGQMWRHP